MFLKFLVNKLSFNKVNFFIILIIALSIISQKCQNTKITDPSNDSEDSSLLVVPNDIKSIQEAITSLPSEGGTVHIKAGIYNLTQGIHINRSDITLVGEQGAIIKLKDNVNEPVILIGTEIENPSKTPSKTIKDIHISNLEIDGNRENQNSETDPNRPYIRNNGIDVRMVNNLNIDNVNIHHTRSGGIVISYSSNYITIDNSSFHHNYFDGIALYDSKNILISNFFCYKNDFSGISLDNELTNTSFNNGSLINNGDNGIFARYSKNIQFSNLIIQNNGNHGAYLSDEEDKTDTGVEGLFFNNCYFLNNNGYGFWLASPENISPNNSVEGCLFSGNEAEAIHLDTNATISQNNNVFQ